MEWFAILMDLVSWIYGPIFVFGLVGNVALLAGAVVQKQTNKTVNIYLGNLAVADLLHLLSIPPLLHLSLVHTWVWGPVCCKIYFAIHYTNWTASIFIITAMGFDRFIAVVKPTQSTRFRHVRFVWSLLLGLWLLSALLVSPIGFHATVAPWSVNKTNRTIYSCGHFSIEHTESGTLADILSALVQDTRVFSACAFVVGFAAPLCLLAIFYGLIIRKLLGQSRTTTAGVQAAQQRFSSVSRLVTAVIALYIACSLPHWIHLLLGITGAISDRTTLLTSHVSTLLGYVSSASNPVLYAWFNRALRESVRRRHRQLRRWLAARRARASARQHHSALGTQASHEADPLSPGEALNLEPMRTPLSQSSERLYVPSTCVIGIGQDLSRATDQELPASREHQDSQSE